MRRMKLVYTFMAAVASKKHPLYTDRIPPSSNYFMMYLTFMCVLSRFFFSHTVFLSPFLSSFVLSPLSSTSLNPFLFHAHGPIHIMFSLCRSMLFIISLSYIINSHIQTHKYLFYILLKALIYIKSLSFVAIIVH